MKEGKRGGREGGSERASNVEGTVLTMSRGDESGMLGAGGWTTTTTIKSVGVTCRLFFLGIRKQGPVRLALACFCVARGKFLLALIPLKVWLFLWRHQSADA